MGKSLIDAIGRNKAFELMEDAVLRAIDENQTLGFERSKAEKVRVMDGMLCISGAGNTAPLVTIQRSSKQVGLSKKSVPIA